MAKRHSTVRFSERAKALLALMAERRGITQSAVLEMVVRDAGDEQGFSEEEIAAKIEDMAAGQ